MEKGREGNEKRGREVVMVCLWHLMWDALRHLISDASIVHVSDSDRLNYSLIGNFS